MQRWLIKTEPSCYSFDDLVRDKRTRWDGVANALAQKHLRAMKRGDEVLIYHTGKQRAVVGTAQVSGDPRLVDGLTVVDLAAGLPLPHPVALERIKQDPSFDDWELVRLARLSVMPVPVKLWKRIEQLSHQTAP